MSDTVIKVSSLSKLYKIGKREEYHTLRDSIARSFSNSFRLLRRSSSSKHPSSISHLPPAVENGTIWALKDVSFDIKRGEVVGIIGRNGAGKSTLLKILSRITEPTEGYAEIRGRVGSLLEVGTGFHPELSGRENIYLNGAILGMKKIEIERKFDEIVAFAEVEKFIDTPVKRYSSGMYVRLAFAVAAHLEPEVLLVDEVLAVGDIAFQKKCLGKMGDVAKEGRTVLLVSHQMNQIRRLCEQCIWLDFGDLKKSGTTVEVVSVYEAAMSSISLETARNDADGHLPGRFLKWEIVEPCGEQPNVLRKLGPVTLRFSLKVNRAIRNGKHNIFLFNNENQLLWGTAFNQFNIEPGLHELFYILQDLPLRPGVYYWKVLIYDEEGLLDNWFCVPEMIIGTEPLTHFLDSWQGILNIPCEFRVT